MQDPELANWNYWNWSLASAALKSRPRVKGNNCNFRLERRDVEPAKYFVRVTKREKRACKACEEQGVQSAPLPARIIDKGLASDRVVIDTVMSKYADHVPIYAAPGIMQSNFRSASRRETLGKHSKGVRRDGGLKMDWTKPLARA
jgi:transposase